MEGRSRGLSYETMPKNNSVFWDITLYNHRYEKLKPYICPDICLERLRTTTKTLVITVHFPPETLISHLPSVSQTRCLIQLIGVREKCTEENIWSYERGPCREWAMRSFIILLIRLKLLGPLDR
jgi:hypothetical protein